MKRLLPLAFALLCAGAWAQAPDPLKSPECASALASLEAARVDAGVKPAAVEPARRRAARICLGITEAAQPSARPPSVADIAPPVDAPQARPPVFPTPMLKPPPEIRRPPVVTACDPGGCWDSNGTRLNRAGPNLIGPGGVCTQQGAVLNCP